MEAIIAIVTIIWSILGIILFFKIWGMTNNVKEMRDFILRNNYINNGENSKPQFTPPSEKEFAELAEEAVPTKPFNHNLKKGDKVSVQEYGVCTFEGIWQGKYAFYPEITEDLPKSPYLVNDSEPYLLIPQNKLDKLIM